MTKQALQGIGILLAMPCLLMAAEFDGSILLGSPTATSIKLNVLATQQGNAYIEYGTLSGQYTSKTSELPLSKDQPLHFNIENLKENMRARLSRIFKKPVVIHGSGRTDAGVHRVGLTMVDLQSTMRL